ncbi:MAG: putative membrane protein YecN with MAPEG domain [Pseudomonadales bacterium]|jgi:uncharacterized membrane protein YecN with MAPEG domain
MTKINALLSNLGNYMSALPSIEITALFAAIFGVVHVLFTLRVGMYRVSNNISVGDGGDKELLKRIRGHGNFIETVPMALLLLLLNELNGLADTYLIILASTLLVARLLHYSALALGGPQIFRPIGMIGTLLTILASSLLLFF